MVYLEWENKPTEKGGVEVPLMEKAMTILTLEKAAIVIVGLIMAYAEIGQAIKYRKSWVKWGLGFMGIYWSVYYIYSIVQEFTDIALASHQFVVRSGILVTLGFVAAGAMMTLKEYRKFDK